MKKILLLGCMLILVCGAPKKTVETEGLEEVVVFGEEGQVIEEPVMPAEEGAVLAPPTEEPTMEEPITPPPIEELPPIIEEEPVEETPPPVEELAPVVEEAPPVEELAPVVEETPPPVEEIAPTIEEPILPPTEEAVAIISPSQPASRVFGFRIQIFASSTEKNAQRVIDDAKTIFRENVYMDHLPPYYKVRVGDCLTRHEAESLKIKALKLGYQGAFIVETMITP